MTNTSIKKKSQLGMPFGTASNRLRKLVMFDLLKQLNKNFCYKCRKEIMSEKDLSIEHIINYLDSENTVGLFFDITNISFSHLKCNVGSARQTKSITHPSLAAYKHRGCRCDECTKINTHSVRKYRNKKLCKEKE